MIRIRHKVTGVSYIGIMAVFLLLFTGCSGSRSKNSNSTPQMGTTKRKDTSTYYNVFEDILIPKDLKVDYDSSYLVQAPGFLTGILALKGSVERNSLATFFENNMAKDNWRLMSSFRSPRTSTILLFQKENRWCVININEKQFTTYVEIGVAPNMNEAESGLHN